MEEIPHPIKFEVKVPYNHELLLNSRKKAKMWAGISLIVVAIFFIVLTIFSARSTTPTAAIIFVVFDVLAVGGAVFFLIPTKAKAKDENRSVRYQFYEDIIQIFNNDETKSKDKLQHSFLYRPFKDKQYLNRVTESELSFELSIFTGTYNGAPQYSKHVIPKDSFSSEAEMQEFKTFLEEKLGNAYRLKLKKEKIQ